MSSSSDSASLQIQHYPSATDTKSIEDFTQKVIDSQSRKNESIDANINHATNVETAVQGRTEVSPTEAVTQPVVPSIDDAMSTSFLDVKSLGVDSWPIRGVEKWEGKVIDVDDQIFTAELIPLGSKGEYSPLTSEFRMKVFEGKAVGPGDTFYLTAQEMRVRGLLITAYSFHIRKPGNWTASDLRDINERTQKRLQLLIDNVE